VAAIGTAVRSNSPELEVGDLVQSMTGWSEYSAGPAGSYLKRTAERCAHDVRPWPLGDDAGSFFDSLSYSRGQRFVQPIEQARTAETRQRRVAKSAAALREHRPQP
jgi:hypothetical protein